MSVMTKGSFSLNLGIVKLGVELAEHDRQCAWELYTEIATRLALTGKKDDSKCSNYEGEVYAESLGSVYAFFQEARRIMRKFPVGKLKGDVRNHLGVLINNIMIDVLRPFLEKHQARYRYWWERKSNPKLPPFERQKEYPRLKEFLQDWSNVRKLMKAVLRKLQQVYKLVQV